MRAFSAAAEFLAAGTIVLGGSILIAISTLLGGAFAMTKHVSRRAFVAAATATLTGSCAATALLALAAIPSPDAELLDLGRQYAVAHADQGQVSG